MIWVTVQLPGTATIGQAEAVQAAAARSGSSCDVSVGSGYNAAIVGATHQQLHVLFDALAAAYLIGY